MNKESLLYGLTYGCTHIERKDNCPFKEIDHFSFQKKVDWIDGLNEDIKQKIIEEYKNCSKDRV